MKNLFWIVMTLAIGVWAVPKPMESIENYNVLMVHGAYGSDKNYVATIVDSLIDTLGVVAAGEAISKIDFENMVFPEANEANHFIGEANLGNYDKDSRITYWLSENVFEENAVNIKHPKDSYIYNWRSFSNPANSSYTNAFELGDRTWNKGNKCYGEGGFGRRRALMEEAQEVKARFVIDANDLNGDLYGQVALDSMRNHSDLYRQLASRYILIGHSMGGVVSREYVQGNFYNGDVDKFIMLDSPHEGTGTLDIQIGLLLFCSKMCRKSFKENRV